MCNFDQSGRMPRWLPWQPGQSQGQLSKPGVLKRSPQRCTTEKCLSIVTKLIFKVSYYSYISTYPKRVLG